MQAAQADLDLALADEKIAGSINHVTLTAEGAWRSGNPTLGNEDWLEDNVGRLVLRKTLLDWGRQQGSLDAARQDTNARQLALLDTRDARRIDIMGRFFDVLLADARSAVDTEYMAVFYVSWDDSKKRYELGEMNASELARLEARYQDAREKRNRSQMAQRTTRQKLAHALNHPGQLPSVLAPPQLAQNNKPLPAYEELAAAGAAIQPKAARPAIPAQCRGVAQRRDTGKQRRQQWKWN